MTSHRERFCPGCGHSDWPFNCPTACPVGQMFLALLSERDRFRGSLQVIAGHEVLSPESGKGEVCDWHCTAHLVGVAAAALVVSEEGAREEKDLGSGTAASSGGEPE